MNVRSLAQGWLDEAYHLYIRYLGASVPLMKLNSAWYGRENSAAAHSRHGITESTPLVAAENAAPIGVTSLIEADMSEAQSRADVASKNKVQTNLPWFIALSPLGLGFMILVEAIQQAVKADHTNFRWLWGLFLHMILILGCAIWGAVIGLYGYFELRTIRELCAHWATHLSGKFGLDAPQEALDWLKERWAWLLPPKLFGNDVIHILGARHDAPVLVVLERNFATLWMKMAERVASRKRRVDHSRADEWSRINVFIAGARFRDADHRARVEATLAQVSGGAVQAPNGVYLYAVFAFMGRYWMAEPDAGVWMDLIDRVLDPDRPPSEAAAQLIEKELWMRNLKGPDLPIGDTKTLLRRFFK